MIDQRDRIAAATALAPLIEAERDEMEARRCLSPAVVEGMRATGIMRAAVAADLDGPELDPLVQVELVEELSRLDGAVGWCAMIASASSYASGFLDPEVARRWFGAPDASLSGQLQPTGRAEQVSGGYRVSGRFRFASGVGHATVMLAGCLVYVDGEVARHDNGRPRVRTVLFAPSQCTVLDTWDTTGLRATGSHDYVVDDLFVLDEDTYDPSGAMRRDGPLYRFPPLFLSPHCGVPLGIGRAAIDAVLELAGAKGLVAGASSSPRLGEHPQVQEAVALAEAELGAARALTYTTLGDLWATLLAGDEVTRRQRGMYRMTMAWIHQVARNVVASMYDVASTSSIERGSPLDRHLRDIATACQHRMVHTRVYGPAGRLLLGMSSGDPTV